MTLTHERRYRLEIQKTGQLVEVQSLSISGTNDTLLNLGNQINRWQSVRAALTTLCAVRLSFSDALRRMKNAVVDYYAQSAQ